MNRTRWKIQAIANLRLNTVQAEFAGAEAHLAFKGRAVEATFQSGIDHASRCCGQYDTCLRFAEIGELHLLGLIVVRMNLNRNRTLDIQEFEQQRKSSLREMSSQQFLAALLNKLAQGLADKGAFWN